MKAILFYISLPFIYTISFLPFGVLYFISDFLVYPILYYVLGYRKEVVRLNLSNSFPEKSEKERLQIEKDFFRFLSDLMMETIKFFTISEKVIRERFTFQSDTELTDKWFEENRSFILTSGHYGNYEWLAASLPFHFKHLCKGPYHALANPHFNQLFHKARCKFGMKMFPTSKTARELIMKEDRPILMGLANDQSSPPKLSYWTTFLNQDTSFFTGPDKLARKFDMPVLFGEFNLVKRGYYHTSFKLITEFPKDLKSGEILEIHAKMLEDQIRRAPQYWLWSHKRWKHKRPLV